MRLIVFAAAALCCAQTTLDVEGRVDPAGAASVTLHAVASPFQASTLADAKGRFRFRKIPAGAYTLIGFAPGRVESRRTVEISPAFATKGVVRLELALGPETPGAGAKVSMRELSIPDSARREYMDAQKLLARNDVLGAVRKLKRATSLAPQFSEAWNNLGTIAYQTEQYEDAEVYFRQALEQDRNAFEPMVNLGGVLLTLGKIDESISYNLYAMLARPEDALANSQLGMSYHLAGNPELAIKYLSKAKKLDRAHFSHPQLMLAEIYLKRGDARSAAGELREFIELHPDSKAAARARDLLGGLKQP